MAKRSDVEAPRIADPNGTIEFDMANFNGRLRIGEGDLAFDTVWSYASSESAYVYNTGDNIVGVGRLPRPKISFENISAQHAMQADYTSTNRHVYLGDVAFFENSAGNFLAVKLLSATQDGRTRIQCRPIHVAQASPEKDILRTSDIEALARADLSDLLGHVYVAGGEAFLLEANSTNPEEGALRISATTRWGGVEDRTGRRELYARTSVEERHFDLVITIRPNADTSIQASHVVELGFQYDEGYDGDRVAGIPGILCKDEELVKGVPLIGASARVREDLFVFALSSVVRDMAKNIQLITQSRWLDIALLYGSGTRAILTLGRDEETEKLIHWALDPSIENHAVPVNLQRSASDANKADGERDRISQRGVADTSEFEARANLAFDEAQDEPFSLYGTVPQVAREAEEQLDRISVVFDAADDDVVHGGIGHNLPPPPEVLLDPAAKQEAIAALQDIQSLNLASAPEQKRALQLLDYLKSIAKALWNWVEPHIDTFAKSFAETAGKTLGSRAFILSATLVFTGQIGVLSQLVTSAIGRFFRTLNSTETLLATYCVTPHIPTIGPRLCHPFANQLLTDIGTAAGHPRKPSFVGIEPMLLDLPVS